MKLAATSDISGPRERVYAALTDPAILKQCIPGCERLVAVGDDIYEATLKIGVAGLKGSYSGTATLADKQPPDAFTIRFDGQGGPGFVRGAAVIRLSDSGAATHVVCDADVQVGGLIAAVGSRLVEAAGRKLAADFFRQLTDAMAARS